METYARLGSPSFDAPCDRPVQLPKPAPCLAGDRITALHPTDEVESGAPAMPGWRCVAESLKAGLVVSELGEEITAQTLWLQPDHPSRRAALSRYLDRGIEQYDQDGGQNALTDDQQRFLGIVARQAQHARKGVFLFNIESYDDVETPPNAFRSPVSSLYSVASGFKPNRILQTHGFDESTRVVYFDYSPNALQIKKCLVEEWDGEGFPDFVRYLFRNFPYPQVFYHLWGDLSPDEVDWIDMEIVWQRELNRWGGADSVAAHWRAYRRLSHEYVCCDIVTDPSPLVEIVKREANAIVWWSNAFFTMYGNWFFALEEREARYRHWVNQLSLKNPELYLYGSDYNNTNVNFIQAEDYWNEFRRHGVSCLDPFSLNHRTVRM